MSDNNGSPVSQREFNRFYQDVREDIVELKDSIRDLHTKVDKNVKHAAETQQHTQTLERLEKNLEKLDKKLSTITEVELPAIKQKEAQMSTKTKLMWGLFVGGLSTLVSLGITIIKGMVGL